MNVAALVRIALVLACATGPVAAQTRVADLTTRAGEVPVRLVGYGLVVGLDGAGDRSFGTSSGAIHTVRSVTNLLRRFSVDVPAEHLRLRNVAAVLVTAEVSPHLRPGSHFDVQVASLGDATTIEGGMLWVTPLLASPGAPAVATAQGPLPVRSTPVGRRASPASRRGATTVRLDGAGLLEQASGIPAVVAAGEPPILALRSPNLPAAARVAAAINAAVGDGVARVLDAGAVALNPPPEVADNLPGWMAAIDTLPVEGAVASSQLVIDARSGMLVAGGEMPIGRAVVAVSGITVRIGADSAQVSVANGSTALPTQTTAQDLAAGLQELGIATTEIAAVFEALRAAGAIRAPVTVR